MLATFLKPSVSAARTRLAEKSTGVVVQSADRSPHEGHVKLPQIARLAKAGVRHLVKQIEVVSGVQLFRARVLGECPSP